MAATDLDRFRTALASASRALSGDSEADVVFATDNAPVPGKIARVVSPGSRLEPRLVAEARGAAGPPGCGDVADAICTRGYSARVGSSGGRTLLRFACETRF